VAGGKKALLLLEKKNKLFSLRDVLSYLLYFYSLGQARESYRDLILGANLGKTKLFFLNLFPVVWDGRQLLILQSD